MEIFSFFPFSRGKLGKLEKYRIESQLKIKIIVLAGICYFFVFIFRFFLFFPGKVGKMGKDRNPIENKNNCFGLNLMFFRLHFPIFPIFPIFLIFPILKFFSLFPFSHFSNFSRFSHFSSRIEIQLKNKKNWFGQDLFFLFVFFLWKKRKTGKMSFFS